MIGFFSSDIQYGSKHDCHAGDREHGEYDRAAENAADRSALVFGAFHVIAIKEREPQHRNGKQDRAEHMVTWCAAAAAQAMATPLSSALIAPGAAIDRSRAARSE